MGEASPKSNARVAVLGAPADDSPVQRVVGAQVEQRVVGAVVDQLDRVAEEVEDPARGEAALTLHHEQAKLAGPEQVARQLELAQRAWERAVLSHRAQVQPVEARAGPAGPVASRNANPALSAFFRLRKRLFDVLRQPALSAVRILADLHDPARGQRIGDELRQVGAVVLGRDHRQRSCAARGRRVARRLDQRDLVRARVAERAARRETPAASARARRTRGPSCAAAAARHAARRRSSSSAR